MYKMGWGNLSCCYGSYGLFCCWKKRVPTGLEGLSAGILERRRYSLEITGGLIPELQSYDDFLR